MTPKIIQIAAAYDARFEHLAVYALDSNGHLWELENAGRTDEYWTPVADLPAPDEA